jgi:hypothetical protein
MIENMFPLLTVGKSHEIFEQTKQIFTIGFELVMVKPLFVKTFDFPKYP